jgi:hypothetical protein
MRAEGRKDGVLGACSQEAGIMFCSGSGVPITSATEAPRHRRLCLLEGECLPTFHYESPTGRAVPGFQSYPSKMNERPRT